jgi:hypothetical protein
MIPILPYVTMLNDALNVAQALMPLWQQHVATGKEPTLDDVRAALGRKDIALAQLDALIALRGEAEGPAVKPPAASPPP